MAFTKSQLMVMFFLPQCTAKQMHRFDGLLTISLRNVYGFLYRLLRLDCKFVELLNRDRELRFGMINLDEKGTYAIDY